MSDDATTTPTPTPADIAATKAPAQEPAAPEVDWKAKAREWETRAKANKDAADELAKIKAANQTEAERIADELAAAQREASEARREALRFRVAAKFGISDEDASLLLTGDDEATMTRQAEAIAKRATDNSRTAQVVPTEGSALGTTQALNGDGLEQSLRTALGIA